jgi:putative aminopeptidase FrvX
VNTLNINADMMVKFLTDLLNIPSPTGYHIEAMPYVREAFAALGVAEMRELPKGTLMLTLPGATDAPPVGLTAHIDTLGLMVRQIKPNGALKATAIGGIVWNGIETENVTVRTADNRRYRGTVLLQNPASHVNRDLATAERSGDTMEVRLDAKVFSADDTRALGIEVGDFIFVDPRVEVTDTGFIRSRFLDNKAGAAVIYGALAALRDAGLQPASATHILMANYEEVGHGGAAGFPNHLAELLTIDMGALGEGQNGDEFSVSLCVKDSGGPYHFAMNEKLRGLAATHNIPLKPDIYPYYSSDGTAYWRAGGAARVGLIGPGVSGSHSYERTHIESLTHTAHLIARYLLAGAD